LIKIDATYAQCAMTQNGDCCQMKNSTHFRPHRAIDPGLEGVIAAETKLSDVDGNAGRLIIAGVDVAALSARFDFEDVLLMLWDGAFQDLPSRPQVQAALGRARALAFDRLLKGRDRRPAMEALRQALCGVEDGDGLAVALDLVATCAVATAAITRHGLGLPLIPPDPSLSHGEDLLTMIVGHTPSRAQVRGLDGYLVTVSDHGLNASTFAARVVASTQAGLTSAVVAGLSALKGPLHGGAPGPVLDMLDAIGTPERAEAWIEAAFARGERLMGFGHRIYQVRDPRADALEALIAILPKNLGRLEMAQKIEQTALKRLSERYPHRALQTNVEYYTALLLEALQIPRAAFTCIFACGRILGWIAHAREQVATGRIVRPQSLFTGALRPDYAA
jgi:citrate synthase